MSLCLSVSTAVPCRAVTCGCLLLFLCLRLDFGFGLGVYSLLRCVCFKEFVCVVLFIARIPLFVHVKPEVTTTVHKPVTRSSCRSHSVLLFQWCALQHCFDCVRSLFCLLPIESSVDVRRDRTYIQVICERVLLTQFWCVYLHCEDIDNHKSNQIVRVDLIWILFQKKKIRKQKPVKIVEKILLSNVSVKRERECFEISFNLIAMLNLPNHCLLDREKKQHNNWTIHRIDVIVVCSTEKLINIAINCNWTGKYLQYK